MQITKQYLKQRYTVERQHFKILKTELKVGQKTLYALFKKFNIPIRQRYTDLTGKKFGKLTAIKYVSSHNGKGAIWECRCDCGGIKLVKAGALSSGEGKSCGCLHFSGYKEISGTYLCAIRFNAKRRNITFELSPQQIYELFLKQKGKCALTGVDIHFAKGGRKTRTQQTASLDRIDSNKGYNIDNVQWVHKKIQKIKMEMSQEELLYWAKLLVL